MTHKEFFDWLRSMQSDKKLTQEMVNGANELLALFAPEDLQKSLIKLNNWKETVKADTGMQLSDNGFDLIADFEGFRSAPYLDAVGVATIGYGNTYYTDGRKVKMTDKPLSKEEAKLLKLAIINQDFSPAVNLMFAEEIEQGKITQNMFDALISLSYNIGIRGLASSSVYKYIKAGDFQKASDAFLSWNKGRVNGKLVELKGLTRRRNAERDLFLA